MDLEYAATHRRTTGDTSKAATLFDRLLATRQADAYQLGVSCSRRVSGSDVQRALLRRAEGRAAWCAPDVSTYNPASFREAYYLKMRISSVDGGVAAPDGVGVAFLLFALAFCFSISFD